MIEALTIAAAVAAASGYLALMAWKMVRRKSREAGRPCGGCCCPGRKAP